MPMIPRKLIPGEFTGNLVWPNLSGTCYIDENPVLVQEGLQTTFTGVSYAGQGTRTVFDRRTGAFASLNMHLFPTKYSDEDKTVEIQVNCEFSLEEATEQANFYGAAIGRSPKSCRTKVETVTIHNGNGSFGGGNKNLLIHKLDGDQLHQLGSIDAVFMHEGCHTSIDPDHLLTPEYKRAIEADCGNFVSIYARDFPQREDMAETFEPWFITRYRKDKISQEVYDRITGMIPNRLAYFDSLNLDVSPYE